MRTPAEGSAIVMPGTRKLRERMHRGPGALRLDSAVRVTERDDVAAQELRAA
jgi:hypothetical protein